MAVAERVSSKRYQASETGLFQARHCLLCGLRRCLTVCKCVETDLKTFPKTVCHCAHCQGDASSMPGRFGVRVSGSAARHRVLVGGGWHICTEYIDFCSILVRALFWQTAAEQFEQAWEACTAGKVMALDQSRCTGRPAQQSVSPPRPARTGPWPRCRAHVSAHIG